MLSKNISITPKSSWLSSYASPWFTRLFSSREGWDGTARGAAVGRRLRVGRFRAWVTALQSRPGRGRSTAVGGAGKVRMLDTWGAGAGDKEPMANFASWATVHRRLCYLRPFLSEALLGAHCDTVVSFMYVRIMLSLFQHRLLVSTERRGHNKERKQRKVHSC